MLKHINEIQSIISNLNLEYSNIPSVKTCFSNLGDKVTACYYPEFMVIGFSTAVDVSLSRCRVSTLHEFRHHLQFQANLFEKSVLSNFHTVFDSVLKLERDASEWAAIEFFKRYATDPD